MTWLAEKQGELRRLYPGAPAEHRFSIGKLTEYAAKRSAGFKGVYAQLSGFAHPSAATALSGWMTMGKDREVQWSSAPRFKNDDDFEIACVWLIELAQMNGELWAETWQRYFGARAEWDAPDW